MLAAAGKLLFASNKADGSQSHRSGPSTHRGGAMSHRAGPSSHRRRAGGAQTDRGGAGKQPMKATIREEADLGTLGGVGAPSVRASGGDEPPRPRKLSARLSRSASSGSLFSSRRKSKAATASSDGSSTDRKKTLFGAFLNPLRSSRAA